MILFQVIAKKTLFLPIVILFVSFLFLSPAFSETKISLKDAFLEGDLSGTVGTYYEYTRQNPNSNFGWATSYLGLKYETKPLNNLNFGAKLFAHGRIYSYSQDPLTVPYDRDIETKVTLPELYFSYSFFLNTRIVAGRYAHSRITHIDDAQSQGAYISFGEIETLRFLTGFMLRFAEIDYDDSEDFGRNNNSQDLSDNVFYGEDSSPYLMFLEAVWEPSDLVTLNPYFMRQDSYAGVYGFDLDLEKKMEEYAITYGARFSFYHVASEIESYRDSNNFSLFPYLRKGPIELTLGYAAFDDGNALNKPLWFSDYFTVLDQQAGYANPDSEKIFAKIKFIKGKFWAHCAYGDNNYDLSLTDGRSSQEYEFQLGYQVTSSIDFNLRLFNVEYQEVNDRDYQKVETRLRLKF